MEQRECWNLITTNIKNILTRNIVQSSCFFFFLRDNNTSTLVYRDNIYEKKISSWIYSPSPSAYINISQYSLTLVAFVETLSLLLQTMIGDKKWKEKRRNFPYARNRLVNTRSILWILDLTCVYKWMSLRRVNKRDAINSPVGGIISRENGNQCPRFLGWGEILVHGTRKQYRRENRNRRKRERERRGWMKVERRRFRKFKNASDKS